MRPVAPPHLTSPQGGCANEGSQLRGCRRGLGPDGPPMDLPADPFRGRLKSRLTSCRAALVHAPTCRSCPRPRPLVRPMTLPRPAAPLPSPALGRRMRARPRRLAPGTETLRLKLLLRLLLILRQQLAGLFVMMLWLLILFNTIAFASPPRDARPLFEALPSTRAAANLGVSERGAPKVEATMRNPTARWSTPLLPSNVSNVLNHHRRLACQLLQLSGGQTLMLAALRRHLRPRVQRPP